ncbi:MAG: DUF1834 family protein [Deltaproteobacteria bacterium]|nr:DUF1834 family protein [Deltaproteobacteria bacterium]
MNYDFSEYEDAILALLEPMRAPGGPLLELKGYAGEIILTEDGLVLVLLNRFPAVLMEISEASYSPGPGALYTENLTAALHVCARSLRSQEETRSGEAGCYVLLREILNRLTGKKPKDDLHPLFPQRVQRLVAGVRDGQEHILVYRMEFSFSNPLCQLEV